MKKIIISLIFIFISAVVILSQIPQSQKKPSPDSFSGLVLNETTPDEVVKLLGQPVIEKFDRLDVSNIGKWLDEEHKEKNSSRLLSRSLETFIQ